MYTVSYSIALVLVYLIFLLLRSTYITISQIPVIYFYILDLRCVATTLALILSHNSNYNVREIRPSVCYIITWFLGAEADRKQKGGRGAIFTRLAAFFMSPLSLSPYLLRLTCTRVPVSTDTVYRTVSYLS
jgi:hypothetical protein